MNRPRDYSEGHYGTDDPSRTGLDVFRHQDNTAPPPNLGQSGHSSKDQPTIWSYYSQRGEHYDKDLVEDANSTVEVLLIFAGLFSAVVTGFISQTYPMLQPDPKDILASLYQELRNPGVNTTMDTPFVAPSYAIRVNCFLFAGLFTSMLVALLGTLVKQWTSSYRRELAVISSHHLRARTRHFRFNGTKRWHLVGIVGLLSIFMHVALFISAIGIIDLLLSTVPTVGYVALSVFLVGVIFFLVTTIPPLFVPDAPFRSPLSNILSRIRRSVTIINISTYFHHIRSRMVVNDQGIAKEEEGLEDPIEQSQGGDLKENNIVRHSIRLDVDIICHLLSTADRVTEQWLLDMCFEELPSLALLEQHDPHVFYSYGIIMEVYNFLAGRCIMTNRQGDKEVNLDHLHRAMQLCKFLAWYVSLPRTQEMRQKVEVMLRKNNGDPQDLPRALAAESSPEGRVSAYTALGSLKHLARKKNDGTCDICESEAARLVQPLPTADINDTIKVPKIPKNDVTYLLVTHTVCLVLGDKRRRMTPESANDKIGDLLTLVLTALERSVSRDKKTWDLILYELQTGVSQALEDAWFVPLKARIKIISSKSTPGLPHEIGFTFPPSTSTTPVTSSGKNTLFPPQLTTPVDGLDNSLDSESTVASTPLIQVTDSNANHG